MMAHKITNPNLKVLFSVGGWNAGGLVFSDIARSPSNRQVFISNVVEFCRQHDFDGFDIDWEYPNGNGGRWEDKQNFPVLIQVW